MRKHAFIIGLTVFGIWMVMILATNAYAKEDKPQEPLTFFKTVSDTVNTDVTFEVLSYKELRSREICAMAKEAGFTSKECEMLVAHLYTENGALAENRHGDYQNFCVARDKKGRCTKSESQPCSLGMIQWNFCVHEDMSVTQWLAKNPEWGDWRFQIRFYLSEITRRKLKYGSLSVAIESWNFGARPTYLMKVKKHVAFAKDALY